MVIRTDVKEAFRSLLTAKQRSLLALIGIVIGIASVIGMVSIGAIVREESLRQFKEMGIDMIEVRKDYDAKSKDISFKLSDILELKKYVPAVSEVAPFLTSDANLSFHRENFSVDLMGVTGSFFDLNKLHLDEGRFITDLDENRYFCVLGYDTAQFLKKAGFGDLLGKKFAFGERIYTVVGTLKRKSEGGGGIRAGNINMAMLTHISTGSRAFEKRDINSFIARAGGQNTALIKSEIGNYFKQREGMQVRVQTSEELIEQMQKNMRLFTLLLGAIGSISLIVGGIGVMNVMLISVTERRKEIGIRRALGAQREDIQAQFIIESVFLCLTGGLIGIVVGLGISYLFSHFSKWEFVISVTAIILGVGVATASGVFFGYYPARSASRLDPIAALRS